MNPQVSSDSQMNAENALKKEMRSGRFSHALLLSGQRGIGKKTLARYLAKGLLCQNEDLALRPCGICRACKRYENGTHSNLLKPALKTTDKSIGIDPIREIVEELSHHGLETGARVILIENADKMTSQAQNCLLKTLEEAGNQTHFILTADSERSILPTILSRCRIERMQPWDDERMATELRKTGMDRNRIEELIRLSEGSIGRALSIHEDAAFWTARENVTKAFFTLSKPSDIPQRLSLLKDKKEDSALYLDILEQTVSSYLHEKATENSTHLSPSPLWDKAPLSGLRKISDAIQQARRLRAANVGWQPVAEQLMQIISEETSKWQQ